MAASLAYLQDTFKAVFRCAQTDEFTKNLSQHFQSQTQGWLGRWLSSSKQEEEPPATLLAISISKVETLYHECLKELLPHLKLFNEYLLLSCNGNTIRLDLEKLRQSKIAICDFYKSTHNLIVLLRKIQNKPETLKSPLRENLEYFSTLFKLKMDEDSLAKWVGKYARIIALEGISNKELPYVLLKWFCENFTCEQDAYDNPEKMKELADLLRRFERADSNFKIDYLHKGLNALVLHLRAFHRFHPLLPEPSLVSLEDAFHQVSIRNIKEDVENGTRPPEVLNSGGVFFENDRAHLEWRASLRPGHKLKLEERVIVLGEQLGRNSFTEDRYLVFNIEGDEDNLVLIAPNKAVIGLIERYSDPKAEVPSYQIRHVERNGLFAIIERLYPPRCFWNLENGSGPDYLSLAPFIEYFKRCIQRNKMLADFRLRDLMFNKKGELRSLTRGTETSLNIKSLDDVFYEIAAGNAEVYLYLLKATGLPTVRVNKFYMAMMRNALSGIKVNFYSSAALDNIVEPDVIDHCAKLSQEAIQLRDELKRVLEQKYVLSDPKRVLTILDESILIAYEKSQAFGRFLPSLKQQIEQMVCSKTKLKMV